VRLFKLPRTKRLSRLVFSADGRRLVAISSPVDDHVESVAWLDVATGEPVRRIPLGVTQFALAPDQGRMAIAYSPGARPGGVSHVRWAAVPEGDAAPDWTDVWGVPHNNVYALAFTPDGGQLAIGCGHSRTHALHLVPISRGQVQTLSAELLVGEIAFSPDGEWLVTSGGAGADADVRFLKIPESEPRAVYSPKVRRTRRLVFAPQRSVLAALSGKQAVLLEAGRANPLAILDGHTARVDDAAFTPDGRRVLTACRDETIRMWDAETGRAVGAFTWSIGKLTAVAVAPDVLTAAASGEKGQIVVWDLDD
jgi:WD40 repeat protein